MKYRILLYYKYTKVEDPEALLAWHKGVCEALDFKGRIIIAKEGINGTLEGTVENTEKYMKMLRNLSSDSKTKGMGKFADIQFKESEGTGSAFPKMKIKIRNEIVSLHLGEDDVDPNKITGKHLSPDELKKWYENNEDFVVLDMRNDYEFAVGRFKNSINPPIENFREVPKHLDDIAKFKDKKVLTVCTGGVRCEKASGYLLKKGFKDVYQLHGGMHKYMEKYPGQDFLGTLYTFDGRIVMDFGGEREIVGECYFCKNKSERYENCARSECNRRFIRCGACAEREEKEWCSDSCRHAKILA
jgi:UPF0176 protein